MPRDAAAKASHAVRLMLTARALADAGVSDRQQRILARYIYLHADSAREWLGRYSQELRRTVDGSARVNAARTPLKRTRQQFAKSKAVRDKLAARRERVEPRRAADMRAISRLWASMTRRCANELCDAVVGAARALDLRIAPVTAAARFDGARQIMARTRLDPAAVWTDVTSYSVGEPHLLATAITGPLGQRVTEINDVHDHLELLHDLKDLFDADDDLALMLRSALAVELSELVALALGPGDGRPVANHRRPLIELVDRERGEEGYAVLEQLADAAPAEGRRALRSLRDKTAAHLDDRTDHDELLSMLRQVDFEAMFIDADNILDYLDLAAPRHVDLGLLLLGHRRLHDLAPPTSPVLPIAHQPDDYAPFLDSPYGAIVAGGFGPTMSARMAGVIARRGNLPRAVVQAMRRGASQRGRAHLAGCGVQSALDPLHRA